MLVLFDFDGTLARTLPAIVESYRYAFDEILDTAFPATQEELDLVRVARFKDICEGRGEGRAEDLVRSFRERYMSTDLEAPVSIYEGVTGALDAIRAEGHQVGIVTNKTRVALEFDLERTGLVSVPWAAVVTADDSVERKPDPRPLRIGLERAGGSSGSAAYVGDGPHDVGAARAAGMPAVGALWGDFGLAALEGERPEALAEAPAELPAILAGLGVGERAA